MSIYKNRDETISCTKCGKQLEMAEVHSHVCREETMDKKNGEKYIIDGDAEENIGDWKEYLPEDEVFSVYGPDRNDSLTLKANGEILVGRELTEDAEKIKACLKKIAKDCLELKNFHNVFAEEEP